MVVYLLIGIQGSGKTTWAAANAARLEAEVLSSDAIRNELEARGLDATNGDRVFGILNERLGQLLATGRNVILDATHARRAWRADSLAVARRRGASVVGVWFDVPEAVCRRRNADRPGGPWGDRAVPDDYLHYVARSFEPPQPGEFDDTWHLGPG